MTPKEKAGELYAKYYNRIEHSLSEEASKFEKDIVKKCALITVEEMLNNGNLEPQLKQAKYRDKEPYTFELEYWFMVKKEIEHL